MMSAGCGSSHGFEIRPDVLLESREDVAVDVVARDELAVVEPLAIVEDEFDAVYEDGLRVLVDGHFQFGAYALQRVGEHLLFAHGEMERLDGVVVEEVVVGDVPSERGSADEVGLLDESVPPTSGS